MGTHHHPRDTRRAVLFGLWTLTSTTPKVYLDRGQSSRVRQSQAISTLRYRRVGPIVCICRNAAIGLAQGKCRRTTPQRRVIASGAYSEVNAKVDDSCPTCRLLASVDTSGYDQQYITGP
jgi:hypothetical protein